MHPLSVRLFGKFCIQRNEKSVIGLDSCKLQELLSYLLIFRNSSHTRESLATLLWEESSTAQSKKYLRQALWQLQAALVAHERKGNRCRILSVEPDFVCLNPVAPIWVDVIVFEQAFMLVQEASGQCLEPALALIVENAVQLYKGDLLEGWYQDWCLYERERLQSQCLIMLDKLISYCETYQKFEKGLSYGLRVLRYDRARESTHRRLMRLYYLAGDRTAALRQYEHCAAALHEELGIKPARRTVMLYEEMRADQFQTNTQRQADGGNNGNTESSQVPEVFDRLNKLQTLLSEIQRQVQKELHALTLILNNRR